MNEAVSGHDVLPVDGAHPNEQERGDEGRDHHNEEQHHEAADETWQAHADRFGIDGRAGVLYDDGGVVAGIRRAQGEVHVARCHHLNRPRGVHVGHLLGGSLVHVARDQRDRSVDTLRSNVQFLLIAMQMKQ